MTALLRLIARTIAALAVLACLALPSSGRSTETVEVYHARAY